MGIIPAIIAYPIINTGRSLASEAAIAVADSVLLISFARERREAGDEPRHAAQICRVW